MFAEVYGGYAPIWTPQSLKAREDTDAPVYRPDAPVTHRRGIFPEKLVISGFADLGIGRKKSVKALGRKSSRRKGRRRRRSSGVTLAGNARQKYGVLQKNQSLFKTNSRILLMGRQRAAGASLGVVEWDFA